MTISSRSAEASILPRSRGATHCCHGSAHLQDVLLDFRITKIVLASQDKSLSQILFHSCTSCCHSTLQPTIERLILQEKKVTKSWASIQTLPASYPSIQAFSSLYKPFSALITDPASFVPFVWGKSALYKCFSRSFMIHLPRQSINANHSSVIEGHAYRKEGTHCMQIE